MKKPTCTLFNIKDGRLWISADWSVYFETTHGIPCEVFERWINQKLKGEQPC